MPNQSDQITQSAFMWTPFEKGETVHIPIDHPSVAEPAFTMEEHAVSPPVMFVALCQPFANQAWFQWRMTQEPKPIEFTVRKIGNHAHFEAVVE